MIIRKIRYHSYNSVFLTLFFITVIISSTGCGKKTFTKSKMVMGTVARITVVASYENKADEAMELAFGEIQRIEKKFSPYLEENEIYQLNRKRSLRASPETLHLIRESLKYSNLTKGKFDVTVYPLVKVWDIKSAKVPSKDQIRNALKKVGYENVKIKGAEVVLLEGMAVDLGGIAKGYAVDKACEILKKEGITDALVDIGGDIYVMGDKGERGWAIGVQHPRTKGELLGVLQIKERAVVTSGDYQRFFVSEGKRYHHILNPFTGYPAKKCQSVTVLAPTAIEADALSTGIFVLGPHDGMELVNQLKDIEVIIVDKEGHLTYSDGVRDIFTQANE